MISSDFEKQTIILRFVCLYAYRINYRIENVILKYFQEKFGRIVFLTLSLGNLQTL